MKIKFNSNTMSWYVKGLGYFQTLEEARAAVEKAKPEKRYTVLLKALVTEDMMAALRAEATKRCTSVADVVRDAIEKRLEE